MSKFAQLMLVAAVPALVGNLGGGLLGEFVSASQRTLSFARHLAAGVILGVVAVDLVPEFLDVESAWLTILAFVAGGAFTLVLDAAVGHVQERSAKGSRGGGASLGLFVGVAADSFSDGIMLGTGSVISLGLALLLALAQTTGDLPEGFGTIASFKRQDTTRRSRLLFAGGLAVPVFVGAAVGYLALRDAPELVLMSILAFTAGVLMSVVVEQVVPEAHEKQDARAATLFLVGGFALSRSCRHTPDRW